MQAKQLVIYHFRLGVGLGLRFKSHPEMLRMGMIILDSFAPKYVNKTTVGMLRKCKKVYSRIAAGWVLVEGDCKWAFKKRKKTTKCHFAFLVTPACYILLSFLEHQWSEFL